MHYWWLANNHLLSISVVSCTLRLCKRQAYPFPYVMLLLLLSVHSFSSQYSALQYGFCYAWWSCYTFILYHFYFLPNAKQAVICNPKAAVILFLTSSFVMWSLYERFKIFRKHHILRASLYLWRSAVRVKDPQICRNIETTNFPVLIH